MMGKTLPKPLYRFFRRELEASADRGVISRQDVDDILTYYKEGQGIDIVRVLVSVGAVLVGLGNLLVVAGNWDKITNGFKLTIIISVLTAAMGASFWTHKTRPWTSMALLYLAFLVYGAAIILVRTMYALDVSEPTVFLLWTAGALILSLVHKDVILFVVAHIAAAMFVMASFGDPIHVWLVLLVVALFAGNMLFGLRKSITGANILFVLLSIFQVFDLFEVHTFWLMTTYVAIGLLMIHLRHDLNRGVFKAIGMGAVGVAGIVMTFSDLWSDIVRGGETALSVIFAVLLAGYMFFLIAKKHLFPLFIIAAIILRYYFDTLYDFMPRALFFVVGGLLILALGFAIERTVRRTLS